MPGGLLNLVAYGNQNIILTGNPSKTFFKSTYAKYTNFGLQKFRIDFDGQRNLRLNEASHFRFKVPRYADLLMETYLVINLPTIWSPIYKTSGADPSYVEYGFKWIKNLGSQIIKEVNFSIGGHTIQKYSGHYIQNLVERDFTENKKQLFYEMIGNTPDLNNPASLLRGSPNSNNYNKNYYPNVQNTASYMHGPEPSIRAKTLYIPLNNWFSLSSKMAFPLVSLQYNELHIEFTLRPINELFVIRDVLNPIEAPYIHANQNIAAYQFYRFLQPPPKTVNSGNYVTNSSNEYQDKRTDWYADIHLMSTYCFLSEEEVRVFSQKSQSYLIKDVFEHKYHNLVGTNKVTLNSVGMVSNWMWFFQRNDITIRNEWSNFTNWAYDYIPNILVEMSGGDYNLDTNNVWTTGPFKAVNHKDILVNLGIQCDGKYRENVWPAGIYNKIEKYSKTSGGSSNVNANGLYCYNFCLNTSPFDLQPNGAFNTSKFSNIEFEFTTSEPPKDPLAQVQVICDPDTEDIIGIEKDVGNIYKYNYDLIILEERYNILKFIGGNAALMYAR
jgi:hypothetical protein